MKIKQYFSSSVFWCFGSFKIKSSLRVQLLTHAHPYRTLADKVVNRIFQSVLCDV